MYDFISFQHGKSKQRVSYQLHITRNTSWIVWGYIKVILPLHKHTFVNDLSRFTTPIQLNRDVV
ncbi:hypothetical protein [Staphylococcus argensis]|uniref:hypothetical protein n=1 Tax=Staphylococcus argensis TaxID=1607738 RepID=UPI00119EAA3A|nr:hypothetical protein [Staphylococcus argensis]